METTQTLGTTRSSALSDFVALGKPRVTALVVATAACGLALAPGAIDARATTSALAGTTLIVAAANALNMWLERDVDAKMARTRNRPIASGRLSPRAALAFAASLACVALALLATVNALTTVLGAFALVTYVAVYTPLKRHSWLALFVGSIAGAMPPLMGWTAVTGAIDARGALLFALLFLWQAPHFAAIAIYRAREYANAGLAVIAVELGPRRARRVMLACTIALVVVSLELARGHAVAFAVVAAAGVAFAALVARAPTRGANAWARRVFVASIAHLVVVLAALCVDRA